MKCSRIYHVKMEVQRWTFGNFFANITEFVTNHYVSIEMNCEIMKQIVDTPNLNLVIGAL